MMNLMGRFPVTEIITDQDVEDALAFLAKTDSECARSKALMKRLDYQRNTIKSLAMLDAEDDAIKSGERLSVARKEALAFTSKRYQEFLEEYQDAVADYETLNNLRNTKIGLIEVWRSESANRRRGTI